MECVRCGHEIMEGAAFCPCCGEKVAEEKTGEDKPVYQTDVKGMRKSGKLAVYRDRTEFATSSVQKTVYNYSSLVSVRKRLGLGMDHIDFITEDGQTETCDVNRKSVHEAFLYIEQAVRPYIAQRKERLLSQGIQYSLVSGTGLGGGGILNISADKAEWKTKSGQSKIVFFQEVKSVDITAGSLEFLLTDGTSRTFAVERDMQDEVAAFVRNAIQPYVLKRTVGFDKVFGIDERIEVNEERGVFHILRQGGREITEECPLTALVKCEQTECDAPKSALGILTGAAKVVGVRETLGAPNADDIVSYVGVQMTIRTDQSTSTEIVRFGDFSLGMSRTNRKYERYLTEATKFMEYLDSSCPECELIVPAPREEESGLVGAEGEDFSGGEESLVDPDNAHEESSADNNTVSENDQLGITKYIEGISSFINSGVTPMTIAIQGSWGNGKNSIMKMISDSLEERYSDNRIWFTPRRMLQTNSEEPLSILVGKTLIRQLSGAESGVSKDSAVKIAKGVIELLAGIIAPDSSAGQNLVEGLFKDGSSISFEKLVEAFYKLVEKRISGPNDKVIILINELDKLAPAKAVELLEAMRSFFDCEGCVFVAAIEYSFFQRGIRENSDSDLDVGQEKALFDEIFQMSFRVPMSSQQIMNYVRDQLGHIGICTEGETELVFYVELIQGSVGYEPKSMDRLFNSFLLLKNMADTELYENKIQRLMLFALLCMQSKFYAIYDQLKRMKTQVTFELLSGLCNEDSEVVAQCELSGEEKVKFCAFAKVFCDMINTVDAEGISQLECGMFARMLEISSITSN